MPDDKQLDTKQIEAKLAEELLRIHQESYGKGAGRAVVQVLDDTVLCILDDLELLPNEQFMIGAGEGQSVLALRGRYQQAIESTYRAAVERTTGRSVTSFASVTKLDPDYSVEIFRLGPVQGSLPAEPDERKP